MTKKIAISGILISMALVLSFIEGLFPLNFGIPGIKLGLANVVTLAAMFILGPVYALAVQAGRIVLASLMFGNMAGLIYSLSGGLLSLLVMLILYKIKRPLFGIIAISICGAVFHNIGQITAAAVVVQDLRIAFYLPVLMLSGIAAGIFVGFAGKYLVSGLLRTNLMDLHDPMSSNRL